MTTTAGPGAIEGDDDAVYDAGLQRKE